MKKFYTLFISVVLLVCCKPTPQKESNDMDKNTPVKVTLVNNDGKFQLLVNNSPFYIKGAGLEFGNIPSVAQHNGNSFRTWRTENGKQSGKEVLDEAQKYGLKVTMGIEVGRERHGFDYNDTLAVKKQLDRIKKEVMELKDHPALLIWGIGNELNLRYKNPKVWSAVNEISEMIHNIDPNHLTTTSLAGISANEITLIKAHCPDIDVLSFQVYGKLAQLPNQVRAYGWDGAYIVSEWGATGHWEVPKTEWGAPIEEHSSLKAANYLKRYNGGIAADTAQCIGSYVFLWGQKQERTPTWYGVFLEDGSETEAVDIMHYLWSDNTWPLNRAPQIKSFDLAGKTAYENIKITKGELYKAVVAVHDFEEDQISYKWEILPESTDLQDGGDFENRPENIHFETINAHNGNLSFKMLKSGSFRLFVYAYDANGKAATANIPFKIE